MHRFRMLGMLASATAFLFATASFASDYCNRGECKFSGNVSACVTEEAYDALMDEFLYLNETGHVSRALQSLYDQGWCARFRDGTRVRVLESGIFIVKIRFRHLRDYPDMWINPEMLASP